MAVEYEELRLGVTLVDNVSAQLDKIKSSLASMGGGAQGSGMERLKRESVVLSETMKGLATNFGTAGETLTKFALAAGAAGVGVIGIGVAVARSLTSLKAYTDEVVRLGQLSRQLGVGSATLKAMTDQFEEVGVSAQRAETNVAGLTHVLADIQKKNSEVRQRLLAGRQGDDRAAMESLLGDLGRLVNDPAAAAERIRQAYQQVTSAVIDGSQVSQAAAKKAFAEALEMPDVGEITSQIRGASAAAEQAAARREADAKAYLQITVRISHAWRDIKDSISSALTPAATAALTPIATALKESAVQINSAIETMRNFQPPTWMTSIGQGISDIGTAVSDALNKTNDAAARLGTQLREAIGNLQPPEWLAKLGNVLGGAAGAVGGAQAAVHGAGERTREAAAAAWNKITGKGGAPTGIDAASAMQVPAFAEGGSIGAGELGVVGERGPELFKPGSSGTILPNAMYAAALAAEYGFGVKGASTLASGALSGTSGSKASFGQTMMGMIPGVGLLKKMKEDAESGHSLRTRLRAMLGLDDPGEPAPWQVSGRQGGGPVTSGANYMVGEGGPELFMRGGSSGGGQGARLIGEQNRQMEELNQNTEGQNAQMRALTDELKILNTAIMGGSSGGGGIGGVPGLGGTPGASGGGVGGGITMGGLGGLPGFGGGGGGGAGGYGGAPSHGGTASMFSGGGGSSGGAGASASYGAPGGGAGAGAAVPSGERAGQAGTGSGKAAAEAYLGKSISNGEYDELMRATHAESGGKNSPEEQAMIMGTILNRARKNPAGIHGALNAPNQFQSVTGTRFAPGPSRAYRQGPSEGRRGSIEGAAESLLHRVPTSQTNFTAASRAAYGPGTNVRYLDQLQRTGGAVYGGTQFGGHLAPEAPSGGDSPHGGGVAAGATKENESRVRELQSKVAGIRKLAIKPELKTQLEAAALAAGVGVEVTSGGQHKHGEGPHTGSTRHDEGGAADLQLRDPKTGRLLDMRVEADQRRMAQFTQEAVASGATGVGAGLSYMGASTMHIGGGRTAAWGGIRGERAPGWLTAAHRAGLAEHQARLAGGLDRKPLDADMGHEVAHKVEGTGHLSVDVSAPAGTKVAAEGGGLFKKTTVSRQTQMQPASEGPAVSV